MFCSLMSYIIISERTVFPDVPQRMKIQESVLSGTAEPPYQNGVMTSYLGNFIQDLISPFIEDPVKRHAVSYQILLLLIFPAVFVFFYRFLRRFFSEAASIGGLLMLQAVFLPAISNIREEADFMNLMFCLIGLDLIFSRKDKYLPVVIAVGVFNSPRIIFLLMFYFAHMFYEGRLRDRKAYITVIACVVLWAGGYILVYNIFGFGETVSSLWQNLTASSSKTTQEMWIALISVFAILSIASYLKSSKFFRASLLMLIPYAAAYFLSEATAHPAQFLPAFLVMIPMSLQLLFGEYTGSETESEPEPEGVHR